MAIIFTPINEKKDSCFITVYKNNFWFKCSIGIISMKQFDSICYIIVTHEKQDRTPG